MISSKPYKNLSVRDKFILHHFDMEMIEELTEFDWEPFNGFKDDCCYRITSDWSPVELVGDTWTFKHFGERLPLSCAYSVVWNIVGVEHLVTHKGVFVLVNGRATQKVEDKNILGLCPVPVRAR